MKQTIIEEQYPVEFRSEDAEKLGQLLKNRRSVVLVGMKRVGISNFLRFFLNHKDIKKHYVKDTNHLFITVDLNDLVEREIFPFWILTFKRISDYVEENIDNTEIKKKISQLFLDSIQSQDLFLTIDGIRKSLIMLTDNGYKPTIFFIRFDRIIESATHTFFGNLQGLIDATDRKLSFVFTSVRPLDTLSSEIFTKHALSVFADTMYIKPSKKADVEIILDTTIQQYEIDISSDIREELLYLVDGYNQYLQFALISLREQKETLDNSDFTKSLLSDERILLQSEELLDSLNVSEQDLLKKIITKGKTTKEEKEEADYLFKTGLISNDEKIFSPLFEKFLEDKSVNGKKENHTLELSKKEHALLNYLEQFKNEVCEREEIIEAVWPEAESLGVSDWAIDRLVARLRSKMKQQESKKEIITIKTRGYKLIENS